MNKKKVNPLLSIVIPNYNYGFFIRETIESALAVMWPKIEVIVVDDGSTDNSREIIGQYPSRVRAIFQKNGGHTAACQAGFEVSNGDWVIFLDSDDLVGMEVMLMAQPHLRDGVSKIQFQMETIDSAGRTLDNVFPKFASNLRPEHINKAITQSGGYPTPPGSANIYSRRFLERILPPDRFGSPYEGAMDSYLLAAAPLLGDVVTIPHPGFSYRIHGANSSAMTSLDYGRIAKDLERAKWRSRYIEAISEAYQLGQSTNLVKRSFAALSLRCALVGQNSETRNREGRACLVADCLVAATRYQGLSYRVHAMVALWLLVMSMMPGFVTRRLLIWKLVPSARPSWLRKLLVSRRT